VYEQRKPLLLLLLPLPQGKRARSGGYEAALADLSPLPVEHILAAALLSAPCSNGSSAAAGISPSTGSSSAGNRLHRQTACPCSCPALTTAAAAAVAALVAAMVTGCCCRLWAVLAVLWVVLLLICACGCCWSSGDREVGQGPLAPPLSQRRWPAG